jgi:hypothetical protein
MGGNMEQLTAANENINRLVLGANLCFHNELWLPGLSLVFVAMDVFASLERPEGATSTTRTEFIAWAEEFLLPDSNLECSGLDLYASRCGLLHRHAPGSKLFEDGKVKQIWYVWGSTTIEELQAAADISKFAGKVIVLHIDNLREALRKAQSKFAEMIKRDPARAARVFERSEQEIFWGIDGGVIRKLAGTEA